MKKNKKSSFPATGGIPLKREKTSLTDFQLRVLEETLKIPLGQVRTYSWIARRIHSPRAARAVGSALKKNPYPLLIPCHRVIKSSAKKISGSATLCGGNVDTGGYSGGKIAKKKLIQLENELKNIFCKNRKKAV